MAKEKILKSLVLSDNFKEVLNKILGKGSSTIASKLLEIENKDEYLFEFSYIDRTDVDDMITFIQSARIKREEDKGEIDPWNVRGRSETRIGRLIRRLFGTKFNQQSIEIFVNKYKAVIRSEKEFGNFEVVQGKDIIHWYHTKRYYQRRGTLGGSCMQGQECQTYFGIYANNPNQVSLCILKNDEGDKIKGRALVWNLHKPEGIIFMDRIYTTDDADVNLFVEYAKQQGWSTKKRQSYRGDDLVNPDGTELKEVNLIVKLDNTDFRRYPYMDTLRCFYPDSGTLSNLYLKNKDDEECYTLNDTGGYYDEFDGDYEPEMVEDWRGNEVNLDDTVWCDYEEAYCLRNEAIYVSKGEHGRGKYFLPNSELLKYSIYSDCNYHVDDVVYSEFMDDWIYKRYAVKMYLDQNKEKWSWNHKLTKHDTMGMIDSDFYINKIIYRDEDDNYHFKDDEFYSYPIEEEPDEDIFTYVPPGTKIDD